MRLAELLGPGPGLEIGTRSPDRVRGVEHVVLVLGAAQQVKLDEARHLAEVAVAPEPDGLEIRRRVLNDLEAIHRDEHACLLRGTEPTCPCGPKGYRRAATRRTSKAALTSTSTFEQQCCKDVWA